VENDNEFAIGFLKGVIEIAGLGMAIVWPNHVLNAQFFGQRLYRRPLAVVTNIGLVGILHAQAGFQRSSKQLGIFVIGWDEYIDATALQDRLLRRFSRVPNLKKEEAQDKDAVQLADIEKD